MIINFGLIFKNRIIYSISNLLYYYLITNFNAWFDLVLGKALLREKQNLLDKGYAKCDDYIRQLAEGRLKSQPGLDAEGSLEAVILKGTSLTIEEKKNLKNWVNLWICAFQNFLLFEITLVKRVSMIYPWPTVHW